MAIRIEYDERRYSREMGAWIAYQLFLSGKTAVLANCSYCDSGHPVHHDQEGMHHMVSGERCHHITCRS